MYTPIQTSTEAVHQSEPTSAVLKLSLTGAEAKRQRVMATRSDFLGPDTPARPLLLSTAAPRTPVASSKAPASTTSVKKASRQKTQGSDRPV